MVEWKNTRKNGASAVGTKQIGNSTVEYTIKKSAGGLSYSLFLGDSANPMYSRATINECKQLAEVYL